MENKVCYKNMHSNMLPIYVNKKSALEKKQLMLNQIKELYRQIMVIIVILRQSIENQLAIKLQRHI